MSYREYMTWVAYRKKYGSMNPVRKYDQGSALVASQVNNAHGGKAKPIDFMPFAPKKEESIVDQNEFLNALGKGAKIGR